MKTRHVAVVLVLLAVAGFAVFGRSSGGTEVPHRVQVVEAPAPSASSSTPAPAAALPKGLLAVTASELRSQIRASEAKAMLVNAWATWCGPCKRELPMLVELSAKYQARGVDFVFVSVDDPADAAEVVATLKERGAALPSHIVRGSLGPFKRGLNPRWPGMLPASFLFDDQGELRHFWGGEAFEKELTPVLDDFLAGKPIEAETRFGLAPGRTER